MIILPETPIEEFLVAKVDKEELKSSPFSSIKCPSTENDVHKGDENLGHKRLSETEKACVANYLALTTAVTPVDPKGKIIQTGDVQGGVYSQGIREFHWPDQLRGPNFHTMVSFF